MLKEKLGTVTVFALILICGFIALFSLGSLGKYYLEAELNKICAIRAVNTRVFPVPAPDNTNKGPSVVVTANCCSELRLSI